MDYQSLRRMQQQQQHEDAAGAVDSAAAAAAACWSPAHIYQEIAGYSRPSEKGRVQQKTKDPSFLLAVMMMTA